MTHPVRRPLTALALALSCALSLALALTTMPAAQALPTCAADPYESADDGLGAPLPVNGTAQRVVCQDRESDVDRDYFYFDAPGGKAYTAGLVTGAGTNPAVVDQFVVAGVWQIQPDGSEPVVIDSPNSQSGNRITTPILPAGRYKLIALNTAQIQYPDFYMGVKPFQGSEGTYTLELKETAPAPSAASLTVPSTVKANSRYSGSFSISAPAPKGGISFYTEARGGEVSAGGRIWVQEGATKGTFSIRTGRAVKGQVFTISGTTRIGATIVKTMTVK